MLTLRYFSPFLIPKLRLVLCRALKPRASAAKQCYPLSEYVSSFPN